MFTFNAATVAREQIARTPFKPLPHFSGFCMNLASKQVRLHLGWMLDHQKEHPYYGDNQIVNADGATTQLVPKKVSLGKYTIDLGNNKIVTVVFGETGFAYKTEVKIYANSRIVGNYKGGPEDPANPRRLVWGGQDLKTYIQLSPIMDNEEDLNIWENGKPGSPGVSRRIEHSAGMMVVWDKILDAAKSWRLDESW